MTRMRELLVDLRSEEHRVQDLQSAVEAVARPLRDAGIEVIVGIAVNRPLPSNTALLVHRATREILLDVRRRRDVSLVTLKLADRGSHVRSRSTTTRSRARRARTTTRRRPGRRPRWTPSRRPSRRAAAA